MEIGGREREEGIMKGGKEGLMCEGNGQIEVVGK